MGETSPDREVVWGSLLMTCIMACLSDDHNDQLTGNYVSMYACMQLG